MIDCIVVSITIMGISVASGVNIATTDILKSLFPSIFTLTWYVVAYLIVYFIHPILNQVLRSLPQKQILKYNMAFIVLYGIIAQVKGDAFFFNKLIGFIGIYFIVGYTKLYLKNFVTDSTKNLMALMVAVVALISLQLITNQINLYGITTPIDRWNKLSNPLLIIIAFTLFNMFSRIKLKSKIINYISSLTLLIYILHENYIFRTYIREYVMYKVWNNCGRVDIFIFTITFAVILFTVCSIIAILYKLILEKLVYKLAKIILSGIRIIYREIERVLCGLDDAQNDVEEGKSQALVED